MISEGTVQVSASHNLGLHGNRNLVFNGGTLEILDTFTTNRPVQFPAAGTIKVADTKELTLSGTITGAGALTKDDPGKLTLTGTNTYSGGNTVTAGTLEGTTDSIPGNVTNNSSLILNQTSTGTFSGTISGTGTLTKEGTGTVVLGNDANSYTGDSVFYNGVIQVSKDERLGATSSNLVFNNGTLEATETFTSNRQITSNSYAFLQVTDTKTLTLSGKITGGGQFVAKGTGTVVLTNAANDYAATAIHDATLSISADNLLGAAAGMIVIDDGRLLATETFASPREVRLNSNSYIKTADTKTLTLTGKVTGTGALTAEGPGSLILINATNDYSGGTTLGSQSTLSVSSDGALGAVAGGLTFDGGILQATNTFTSARTVTSNSNAHFQVADGQTLTLSGNAGGNRNSYQRRSWNTNSYWNKQLFVRNNSSSRISGRKHR